MNKNGTLVILNDLKNEREIVEKKYNEQKNKKISCRESTLYSLGFAGVFGVACAVCPANIVLCSSILLGYGIGVPLAYSYYLLGKEIKLKKQLDGIDKNISDLELDIIELCSNHHYDSEDKCFVYEGEVVMNKENALDIGLYNEEFNCENSGPSLRLKR